MPLNTPTFQEPLLCDVNNTDFLIAASNESMQFPTTETVSKVLLEHTHTHTHTHTHKSWPLKMPLTSKCFNLEIFKLKNSEDSPPNSSPFNDFVAKLKCHRY